MNIFGAEKRNLSDYTQAFGKFDLQRRTIAVEGQENAADDARGKEY